MQVPIDAAARNDHACTQGQTNVIRKNVRLSLSWDLDTVAAGHESHLSDGKHQQQGPALSVKV